MTHDDPVKVNTLILTNPLGSSYVDCGQGEQDSWTPMGWYCNVIAVDPMNPDVVWAGGVDLFRSDDGGRIIIDDQQVAINDGLHEITEKSGQAALAKANRARYSRMPSRKSVSPNRASSCRIMMGALS